MIILSFQDVFMMIRRKKTTIFTDAKDTTTVLELKKITEGILKVAPKDQRLYNKDNTLMDDDSKTLSDYGITMMTAKAQAPAVLGLALRIDNEFEPLEMCPYSQPPDLPEVMKQDGANGEQA
jgi:elongin-B